MGGPSRSPQTPRQPIRLGYRGYLDPSYHRESPLGGTVIHGLISSEKPSSRRLTKNKVEVYRTINAVIRYWIEFGHVGKRHPINLGCGVTASDIHDALLLVGMAFPDLDLGSPLSVIEDVDVSSLDANHVLPNLGNVLVRGVWWPRTSREMAESAYQPAEGQPLLWAALENLAEELLGLPQEGAFCTVQEWDDRIDCCIKLDDGRIVGEMVPLLGLSGRVLRETGERLKQRKLGENIQLKDELWPSVRISRNL